MLDCALGFPLYGLSERALGFSQLLAGAWVLSMPTCRVVGTVVNLGELGLRTPPGLMAGAGQTRSSSNPVGDPARGESVPFTTRTRHGQEARPSMDSGRSAYQLLLTQAVFEPELWQLRAIVPLAARMML